jgi:hypothetical protein
MRSLLSPLLALVLSTGASFPPRQTTTQSLPSRTESARSYDGNWWSTAGSDERSGFLDGSADCLVSVARAPWLSRSLDDLDKRIDQYYKERPNDRPMLVTAVWRKIVALAPPDRPRSGGEKWTNPHGYYDGVWWHQTSESERLGFLEGYIGCISRDVKQPPEEYSRSASYYNDRIWSYLDAHPKAMNEAIANILSRYRDQPKPQ